MVSRNPLFFRVFQGRKQQANRKSGKTISLWDTKADAKMFFCGDDDCAWDRTGMEGKDGEQKGRCDWYVCLELFEHSMCHFFMVSVITFNCLHKPTFLLVSLE